MSSPNIRTLLVDDEPLALERMRHMLSAIEGVSIIGECSTGTEAVESISNENPDVVFLDINLPDLDGFEILSELSAESIKIPLIIFQTAFDQHAIRAFEVNAIDYLLKPFRRDRIEESIKKARARLQSSKTTGPGDQIQAWIGEERQRRASQAPDYIRQVEIRDRGETSYVPVDEIDYFQADGNYIEVHTDTKTYLWRQTLGKLEGRLDPERFMRISRSVIIPLSEVNTIETPTRGEVWVILRSSARLALSRNLSALRELLKSR